MEKIKFNNGKLKVLQISDPQDLHWVRHTMTVMLSKACDIVKPDLIIFTGDNILGNHISDKRFSSGTRNLTIPREYDCLTRAIYNVLKIPTDKNIPFAAIFGNHDDRNSFSKDQQADIFRRSRLNRGFVNTGALCGDDCLDIYSSDGNKKVMNFWLIDTARYDRTHDKCYAEIPKETTRWFISENDKQKEENGGKSYPSMIFMHVPLPVVESFTEECGADEGTAHHNGKHYKLKEGLTGELYEPVGPITDDNGFYDVVLKVGNVSGIVSGHDHLNSFEGTADNIRFIATAGSSFRCYGNHLRGVRVFEFDESSPENFSTYTLNYRQILGDNLLTDLRYFWDADDMEDKKAFTLGIAAAVGLTVTAAGISRRIKTNRHK